MARTGDEVVVHHPTRLHECIADGGADKFESAFQQVLAHRVTFKGASRKLGHRAASVDDRPAAHEIPEVAVKASELALDSENRLRIRDRGGDFKPVADN